jgi:dihydroneopterin aldolase
MDIIFIHQLQLTLLVGIYEWEKITPQPIQFDLEIGLPHARAATSNAIADTIDYSEVVSEIENLTNQKHFLLVEKLAEDVARLVLDQFKAPWVKVSISKLNALPHVKRLGVSIERGQRH